MVGQGGALLPLCLADLLGLSHQALGQGVGQVEGEGTRDDGGPGGGGHGGGDAVAPGPGAQVTEDRVLAGQLLVGGQVGGHEGQGVPPLGEDREVVPAQEDGHHGDDAVEQGPALLHVLATRPALLLQGPPLGDLAPGPEERLPDHVVKAFVDGQEEAAQPLGLAGRRVGPAGRHGPARAGGPRWGRGQDGVEVVRGNAVHARLNVPHNGAHAVAVNVDDGDLGQVDRGPRGGRVLSWRVTGTLRQGVGVEGVLQGLQALGQAFNELVVVPEARALPGLGHEPVTGLEGAGALDLAGQGVGALLRRHATEDS